MKRRLFLYTTLIMCTGFMCLFGASVYTTYANNLSLAKDNVAEITQIYADFYVGGADIKAMVNTGNDIRLTVIAPDGKVLADSHPLDLEALDNLLGRPEVQAALDGAPAAFVRYSETLGTNMVFYAQRADAGGSYVFIRAALPVERINTYLLRNIALLVFLLLGVAVLCFLFTRSTIRRITKPFGYVEQKLRRLADGEYATGDYPGSYEEIDKVIRVVDEIALILQDSITALRDEKSKAEYIINNIGDGLFAVDENKSIVLINSAAMGIFNVTPNINHKNLTYLSFDKTLIEAVDDCIRSAKNALFEMHLHGRVFFVMVKRLSGTKLTMVVLSDVTESRENAKRREEFFANASHELKTPLTAIKGFNELTALNNKDENLDKYITGITRETDRMLALIGDMLKLSELESSKGINSAPVSLAKVAGEVCATMAVAINDKGINVDIVGDGTIMAEPEHVYELVKNLVENAVRYNNQGGRVSIVIGIDRKSARLSVSDSGIGIPVAEQARVFERFYRVEKGRAQRDGGTGLGLSIVKHICALYGWRLSLKSKLGVGTDVTITFSA